MRPWKLVLAASLAAVAASSCQSSGQAVGPPRVPLEQVSATTPATTAASSGVQPQGSSPTGPSPTPGYYVDGTDSTPHYVFSVTSAPDGFSGWMFFVYQDGHIAEIFHYHSTKVTPDLLLAVALLTDTTNEPFPYPHVPAGSLPGSQPVPPGRTFSGTYGSAGFALPDCGAYLYWANPANNSKTMSCTFSYSGTTAW